jgi:hypothetical protein
VHKIWARLRCASRLLAPGHLTCLELCVENASTYLHPRTESYSKRVVSRSTRTLFRLPPPPRLGLPPCQALDF